MTSSLTEAAPRADGVAAETVLRNLARIEAVGRPDYLDQRSETVTGTKIVVVHPPRDSVAERREVQRVYGYAFALDVGSTFRRKVLRSYTANFPHIAFDPEGWLWPLWQKWRARRSGSDKTLIAALASGIQAPGSGWMSRSRSHYWLLQQARTRLDRLRANEQIQTLYKEYSDGTSPRNPPDVQHATEERCIPPLLALIRAESGYPASFGELKRLKLAGVLRLAASKPLGVRERELHGIR
jgi:hypothetical protein